MDSKKFGVKLKPTGGDLGRLGVRDIPSAGRRGTTTKPGNFKDIKKLFDAKDDEEENGDKKKTFGSPESHRRGKPGGKVETSGGIGKVEGRFQRNDVKRSSLEKKTVQSSGDDFKPQVAVSKVYSKDNVQAFQATIENKVHRQGSREESPPSPRDKQMAASVLKANLALIRTRPGSGKKEEKTVFTSSKETKTGDTKVVTTTTSRTTNIGKWSGGASTQKFGQSSVSSAPMEFGISYTKKTGDSTQKNLLNKNGSLSRNSSLDSSDGISHRSVSSDDNSSLDLRSVQKFKSLLGDTFNSEEKFSINSAKIEPKFTGSTAVKGTTIPSASLTGSSSKSDTKPVSSVNVFTGLRNNRTGLNQQSDTSKAKTWQQSQNKDINTSKEESQPEWMNKSKEMVSKFQNKLKPSTNVRSIVTSVNESINITKSSTGVTTKTTTTKTITTDINSNKMASRSLENKIPVNVIKSAELSDTGSDISSRSSEVSSSSWRREERQDSVDSIPGVTDLKSRKYTTRKMDSDQFKRIKGNFEQKSDSADSTDSLTVRKLSNPRVELTKKPILLRGAKNILERRNSLEQASSPPPCPRNATIRVLKEAGKIPNVKAVARDINTTGRVRSSSLGSIELGSTVDQEYNEFLGFEDYKPQEWAASSDSDDSEGLYEPVGPERHGRDKGQIKAKTPTRRLGQKSTDPEVGKVTGRPVLKEPQSSTEGSSKEGTLESPDERGGVEADAENDSDSSNSEIYESIDQEWASSFKPKEKEDSPDIPPELPAERKKKHKEKSGVKALGKLKKLYKPKKKKNPGLTKVVSAPVLQSVGAASSSGVLNKIGDKLKNLKKTKSDNSSKSGEVEIVIESSDYNESDQEHINSSFEEIDMNVKLDDIEYIDSSSSVELIASCRDDSKSHDNTGAPPLPPKNAPPPISSDNSSVMSDDEHNKPPPLPKHRIPKEEGPAPVVPPRKSMIVHSTAADDETPALPPRNSHRISTNLDINMVVPLSPGIAGVSSQSTGDLSFDRNWKAGKESYLLGHNVKTGSLGDLDNMDGGIQVPPPPPRKSAGEDDTPYLRHDPQRSDEEEFKKQSLGQKNSSAYLKMQDMGSSPDKSPTQKSPKQELSSVPFSDLLMFRSQYDKQEDDLYLDLDFYEDEDQLYGTLDQRYEPKIYGDHLYQYYNKDKINKASNRKCAVVADSDEDEDGERIYEEVPDLVSPNPTSHMDSPKPKSSTLDTFAKTGSILRSFWCEMPEVKKSGLLDKLTAQDRKIQEAMFEIVTSEATYLRSLNVLIDVFLMSTEFSAEHSDRCIITRQERHVLFSNIGAIREASERFLADLETKWQKSVMMDGLCEVIDRHASKHFECYVRYCSNQTFQDRAVQTLTKKAEFYDAMKRMEKDPLCQGLPMISFLLLPMQRITRLPLLVDAICHRMEPASDKHKSATKALEALNKVVRRCNEGARRMQQTEQMCHLVQSLEFKVKLGKKPYDYKLGKKSSIKEIPLVSASRYLIKQGELTRILPDAASRIPLRKKVKQPISVFLFNDVLLVSKKKRNRFTYSFTPQNLSDMVSTQYVVTDYALRNVVQAENLDGQEKRFLPQGVPSGCKNMFVIVLLENHDNKEIQLVLSCKSPSDKTRWMDALSPSAKEDESEKIYEEWDCPQVQCHKKYTATEPDELSLEESDVVNVFKKMADGWYEGERIRDGERGWFPANHTEEIINSHVRARNLRLRYRLLLASQDYENIVSTA